jgi:hypothetical protein
VSAALAEKLADKIVEARDLYYRLVLLVGPGRSGKTAALRQLHNVQGSPLLNLNLALSTTLLDLSARQRALRVARLVDEIVQEQGGKILLLDCIEMLFHPDLKQNPLRLLQNISRNRTVVAAWRGTFDGKTLVYAVPEHPEFQRVVDPEALIVSARGANPDMKTSAQEPLV